MDTLFAYWHRVEPWQQLMIVGLIFSILALLALLAAVRLSAREALKELNDKLARRPHRDRYFARTLEALGFQQKHIGYMVAAYGEYIQGWRGVTVYDEDGKEWEFHIRSPFKWFFMRKEVRRIMDHCRIRRMLQ